MQKLLPNSISIICNAKGCNGRLSLAIDSFVIHIDGTGHFTDENDEKIIENPLNYRFVNLSILFKVSLIPYFL